MEWARAGTDRTVIFISPSSIPSQANLRSFFPLSSLGQKYNNNN